MKILFCSSLLLYAAGAHVNILSVKILVNKIQCRKCGDVIESTYEEDFKLCVCEAVGIEGGKVFLGRTGEENDLKELSMIEQDGIKVLYTKRKCA